MATALDAAAKLPVTVLGPQGALFSEGNQTGKLYILKSGDLEVVREGSVVAGISDPGAVIGEISALLDQPHTATVRSRTGAEVYVIDNPAAFLDANPSVAREIAKTLASRLTKTTALLVDLRARSKEREDQEMFEKIFALLK